MVINSPLPGMKRSLTGRSAQVYFAHYGAAISDRVLCDYLEMMPSAIRSSIERYKRWQDRQATLFGKLLLLKALQLQCKDAGLRKFRSLKLSQFGKPFINGGPEFNISHSEDIVVVALAHKAAIGIDIEKIRPIDKVDFSLELPEIISLYENYDADVASHLFFDCWTKKEAVLKAFGKGLLVPLKDVVLTEGHACINNTTWFVQKLSIDKGYCCHVASEKPLEHVRIECVDLMTGLYNLS